MSEKASHFNEREPSVTLSEAKGLGAPVELTAHQPSRFFAPFGRSE